MNYLTINIVLMLHERSLELFGGASGIRNQAGLEAAIASLEAKFADEDLYPTVFDKAAAYASRLAESQAFEEGNRRTDLAAALTFLALNGYEIETEDD